MPLISIPRGDAWSGGQYSLLRATLGLYLGAHFARLLPHGAELWSDAGVLADPWASPLAHAFPNLLVGFSPPAFITLWLTLGCASSLLLALGVRDRPAALGLWYILASLLGRNPLTLEGSLPYLGWLLVAHAFVPRAPYLSLAARGRLDPDGGWRLPRAVHVSAWVLLAASYASAGLAKLASPAWIDGGALVAALADPLSRPTALAEGLLVLPDGALRGLGRAIPWLELAFVPLILVTRLRPWLWLAGLLGHAAALVLLDLGGPSLGVGMLHLVAFDPAWLPARAAAQPDLVFYDGRCGLCHRWVRFLLAEDRGRARFLFSPLQGELIVRRLEAEQRRSLPDSVVVLTAEGRLLLRSGAVLHILSALGGLWRVCAWLGWAVPRPLRDLAYDAVAALRQRLFRSPDQACPLLPPHLATRFVP